MAAAAAPARSRAESPDSEVQYGLLIDARKCIGCHACTVACKAEFDVPLGFTRSWVEYVEKGNYPDVSRNSLPRLCNHCRHPICVDVCPTGATYKRAADGIVVVDADICIGCKYCIQACPYDARFLNPVTGAADKCDFCLHRVSQGLVPACVETCVGRARIFGDINDPQSDISRLMATNPVTVPRPEKGIEPNAPLHRGGPFRRARTEAWALRSRHHAPPARKTEVVMLENLPWGLPVIGYLFLAGLGAGSLTVSASVLLRGGGGHFGGRHYAIARYGAFIAPPAVALGSVLLVLEPGSFQAGHWFRFLNLYTVIDLSPMSIGTWLLTVFLVVSVLYAFTFRRPREARGDNRVRLRRALAWVSVPLGIAVAIYTGVLLGAMPSRPFWNSPVLALLFLLSSLSNGIAAIMLARALFGNDAQDEAAESDHEESAYILTASDMLLIGFELVAIFLFLMFAQLTVGDVKYAVSIILNGGRLAFMFWVGVVFVGLLLPGLIELRYAARKLLYHRSFAALPRGIELMVPAAVLAGGFVLRFVIVVAGQVTGPVGI